MFRVSQTATRSGLVPRSFLSSTPIRYASTRTARNVAVGTAKYLTVIGISGYIGFALARQIVAPNPVPLIADLPEEEILVIREYLI